MEVKFELTKESFVKSTKAGIILLYKRILLVCIGVAIMAAVLDGLQHGFNISNFLTLLLVSFLLTVITISATFYFRFLKSYNKLKLHQRLEYVYSIHAEGIKLEKLSGNLYFRWNQLRKIYLLPAQMIISLKSGSKYAIPISAFIDEQQKDDFFNTVKQHLSQTNLPLKHPPYWRGLLGLIPIVGLINGIIMFLAGLNDYRDKKYSLIGLAGILFTFALFYWADNNHQLLMPSFLKSGFTVNEQMDLNSLVKEIEFYKIQNGRYPDSLQQLNLKQEFTNIYDPLSEGKKAKLFNYHKIGSKYTLFSSGVDEIPNTADDIYPTIDTIKIGLIIKNNRQ